MAGVKSLIVWICALALLCISFYSYAIQNEPSIDDASINKGFVLPPGWKPQKPIRFTKRASTIEYEFSGAARDNVNPDKLFSTYAVTEESKNPFISNYINECIEGKVEIYPELFIFTKNGFRAGGFECKSEINNALIIYLLRNNNTSDEYLVFTWHKKNNENFSKKEIMLRLGYSLQSAVQFLMCDECALDNLNDYTQMIFNFLGENKHYENSMHKDKTKAIEHYYSFYLSVFGIFPGVIYGDNEACKLINLSGTVKICGFHEEKNQISVEAGTQKLTDISDPNLIGINIKNYNESAFGYFCEKGKLYPLRDMRIINIENFYGHKWFVCKDSSKIYSVNSVIIMDVSRQEKLIFEYIWSVPDKANKNINVYVNFLNKEILKKLASVYFCEKNSYLHDC